MVATQVLAKNDNSAYPGRKATRGSKTFATRGGCRHDILDGSNCISFTYVSFYIMALLFIFLPKITDSLKIIDVV